MINGSRSNFFARKSVTSFGTSSLLFQPVNKHIFLFRFHLMIFILYLLLLSLHFYLCPVWDYSQQHTNKLYFSHFKKQRQNKNKKPYKNISWPPHLRWVALYLCSFYRITYLQKKSSPIYSFQFHFLSCQSLLSALSTLLLQLLSRSPMTQAMPHARPKLVLFPHIIWLSGEQEQEAVGSKYSSLEQAP